MGHTLDMLIGTAGTRREVERFQAVHLGTGQIEWGSPRASFEWIIWAEVHQVSTEIKVPFSSIRMHQKAPRQL